MTPPISEPDVPRPRRTALRPGRDRGRARRRTGWRFLLVIPLLAGVACGGGAGQQEGGDGGITPEAGLSFGQPPLLQGRQVMVLPLQQTRGVPSSMRPESELVFALRERAPRVDWILPDRLREIAARTPGIDLSLENLPVGAFLQVEVQRVGDPLYGHLRRLGGLTGADLALLPIQVRFRSRTADMPPAMEIAASLVDVRSGRVYWFGIVDGAAGEADDPATLASAADALARTLTPARR